MFVCSHLLIFYFYCFQGAESALAHRGTLCELYVGGEGVARGYHKRPDLNSEKFLLDPFSPDKDGRMYQTGDLVIFGDNPGDPIKYNGRIDTQVKIRGKRLELDEVKSSVVKHDHVKDAHVLLRPFKGKNQLIAYIVWEDEIQDSSSRSDLEDTLLEYFQENMEDYKQPAAIVSFPLEIKGKEYITFPITVGGKVDLKILPDPEDVLESSRESIKLNLSIKEIAETMELEEDDDDDALDDDLTFVIVKILTDILGIDDLSPTDDFFKAGMSSVEIPSLKFQLKHKLSLTYELATSAIFDNPTAEKLANYILNPTDDDVPQLSKEDFVLADDLKDKPLPGFMVWFMSLFVAVMAYATSLCATFFLILISVEIFHESGKCSKFVERDLQNDCESPDKWMGFWFVAFGALLFLPVCIYSGLILVAFFKWLVIGKYKPGYYSVDGLYYFRWLYVHHLEVFAIRWLLPTLPFRCTAFLNLWLRLMGAEIGKDVIIDTTALHEMCCLKFGDGVTVQNDAMICGHAFANIKMNSNSKEGDLEARSSNEMVERKALIIGTCWLKPGAKVGPYAMVHPSLPRPRVRKSLNSMCTVVEGILPGFQSTSRIGETIQLKDPSETTSNDEYSSSLVWTPPVPFYSQILGTVMMIVLQVFAFDIVLFIMYYFFAPAEPRYWDWFGRCFLFFSPWPMGIPYALMTCIYKWLFIGKLKAGDTSTPYLDTQRWLLGCLLQSRLQTGFELAGASCEILNTYYRMMGMTIGWNCQVMPLNIVEHDLFSIGDCCAFGGQVMVVCRDQNGKQGACSLGDYSAITNSAGMLAGSKIGRNCLIGNLTLLPPNFHVPDDSKCVGTKYMNGAFMKPMVFANTKECHPDRLRSNIIMLAHVICSICIDFVYLPEFFFISLAFIIIQEANIDKQDQFHLVHNAWRVQGGYIIVLAVVFCVTLLSTLFIITIKRCTPKLLGDHQRDSLIFVLFIFLTKVCNGMKNFKATLKKKESHLFSTTLCFESKQQMNMESWSYVYNGTPIQSLLYRLLGATISLSSRLFMRYFADVDGLEIGENTILTYDCYIEQHKKTPILLDFKPVSLLRDVIVGMRTIVLQGVTVGDNSQIYPISAVPPNENIGASETVGGLLAVSYHTRSHEDAVAGSIEQLRIYSAKSNGCIGDKQTYDEEVDMLVVGAGVSGLVAAQEFSSHDLNVRIIEKESKPMGCWQSKANTTSQVAVTEATYRLSASKDDSYEVDYPSREQVLRHGHQFIEQYGLGEKIEFNAEGKPCVYFKLINTISLKTVFANYQEFPAFLYLHLQVLNIKDVPGSSERATKKKHGYCIVTYKNKHGHVLKIKCKGVFIATGAQAERNEFKFPNEDSFTGEVAFGSQNDCTQDSVKTFKGKRVCIIGGGAFAIENVKTALLNGAKHVTVVHRNDIQVWPRCLHYLLSSESNRKFVEYSEVYDKVSRWADLTVGTGPQYDLAPFMHPDTSSQPTANDLFFTFHKLGLVTLIHGNVMNISGNAVKIDKRDLTGVVEVECEVLLKCVGWKDPGRMVKNIYPDFKSRNFIFLDQSPRLAFICDPRFRHEDQKSGKYSDVLDTVPIGGTYSVPITSRVAAMLQIYSLGNPLHVFDSILESIPTSKHVTCSWSETKFQYPKSKEISDIIGNVINEHKSLVKEKHNTLNDFLKMTCDLLRDDLKKRVKNCGGFEEAGFYYKDELELIVKGFSEGVTDRSHYFSVARSKRSSMLSLVSRNSKRSSDNHRSSSKSRYSTARISKLRLFDSIEEE